MSGPREALLLDRAVFLEWAMGGTETAEDNDRMIGALTDVYASVLYEDSGMSALKRRIREHKGLAAKLVPIAHDIALEVGTLERELLDQTVRIASAKPAIMHAVEKFRSASGDGSRSFQEILGYVIRLLLISRQLNADILPWKSRLHIFVSLFREAEISLKSKTLESGIVYQKTGACCFPYLPPVRKQEARYVYCFLNQAANVRFADSRDESELECSSVSLPVHVTARSAGHEVFISYSQQDQERAVKVCQALEEAGIRCWIAPRDITPGSDWASAIVRAINDCLILALIFSRHSNESTFVRKEVERAVSKSKTIVPLRVENATPSEGMELFLQSSHWLDAFAGGVDPHLAVIVQAVRSHLPGS